MQLGLVLDPVLAGARSQHVDLRGFSGVGHSGPRLIV